MQPWIKCDSIFHDISFCKMSLSFLRGPWSEWGSKPRFSHQNPPETPPCSSAMLWFWHALPLNCDSDIEYPHTPPTPHPTPHTHTHDPQINCCIPLTVCESFKMRPDFPDTPDAPLCAEPLWTVCSLLDVQSHASLSWLLGGETCRQQPQRSRLTAGVSGPVKTTAGRIRAQPEGVAEVWQHLHVCLSPCVAVPCSAHRGRRCSGCRERRSRLFSPSAWVWILLSHKTCSPSFCSDGVRFCCYFHTNLVHTGFSVSCSISI